MKGNIRVRMYDLYGDLVSDETFFNEQVIELTDIWYKRSDEGEPVNRIVIEEYVHSDD